MLVLGIHGPSRSGKDTIYQILLEEFPLIRFERQGFADALKVSAAKSLGLNGSDAELISKMDALKEEGQINTPWSKVSGRKFLQYYGTEAHRDMFGTDFWLDHVIRSPLSPRERYLAISLACVGHVVPDCRSQNEVGRVIDANGELWKVRREVTGHTTGHVSEAELKANWDLIIDNNGTKDELRATIKNCFNRIANNIINDRVNKAVGA